MSTGSNEFKPVSTPHANPKYLFTMEVTLDADTLAQQGHELDLLIEQLRVLGTVNVNGGQLIASEPVAG